MARIFAGVLFVAFIAPIDAQAVLSTSEICEQVTQIASQQSGVPIDVMRAISLTETGRTIDGAFRAWPWAVNMEGDDAWFDDRVSATQYALSAYDRGARSFDVGCFQINYKWHGQHFASIEEMFDPLLNARYAARLLAELYAEKGDWIAAAGAYHSRTPEFADRYSAKFQRILTNLVGTAPLEPGIASYIPEIPDIVLASQGLYDQAAAPRVNRFPLLQPGVTGALGSLVPRISGNGPGLLIGASAPVVQ